MNFWYSYLCPIGPYFPHGVVEACTIRSRLGTWYGACVRCERIAASLGSVDRVGVDWGAIRQGRGEARHRARLSGRSLVVR